MTSPDTSDNVPAGGALQLPGPLDITLSEYTLSSVDTTLTGGVQPSPGTKAIIATSPVVDALSSVFLFDTTSDGDKALSASTWLQILLAAADRDVSDAPSFRAANPVEHDLDLDAANALLVALARGHVFQDGPIEDFSELDRRLVRARAILDAAGELNSLQLPGNSMTKVSEFDSPAVDAVPGRAAQAGRAATRDAIVGYPSGRQSIRTSCRYQSINRTLG